MTGATNDAEEPCQSRHGGEVEHVPTTPPTDLEQLLQMFREIDRQLDGDSLMPERLELPSSPQEPLKQCDSALTYISSRLLKGPTYEGLPLATGANDDVELFIGQLPFNFSHPALAEALQRLISAPQPVVTRVKPGPKPTCAFISIKNSVAPSLTALNKRVLCDRNGFWVAPVITGERGFAELAHLASLRVESHSQGLPVHPLVIEPVVCKSKAPKASRNTAAPLPPGYAEFMSTAAPMPGWLPPALMMPVPHFHSFPVGMSPFCPTLPGASCYPSRPFMFPAMSDFPLYSGSALNRPGEAARGR